MAYIGMLTPVAAPVDTETMGSAITYGTGMIIGPAVAANLNLDVADNPDYGDDIIIDNDNGVNGYSGTLETNNITAEGRAALLGWTAIQNTATPPAVTHYEVGDGAAPYVGWGFIRVKMFRVPSPTRRSGSIRLNFLRRRSTPTRSRRLSNGTIRP